MYVIKLPRMIITVDHIRLPSQGAPVLQGPLGLIQYWVRGPVPTENRLSTQ